MRFALLIGMLLLGISLASPAQGQPATPACPGCQAMDITYKAHKGVLDDLQRAFDRRTARVNALLDKGLQGPLTAAERSEAKQLGDELQAIGKAKDEWQAIVDKTKLDADNCKKTCPIDAPSTGTGSVPGGGGVPVPGGGVPVPGGSVPGGTPPAPGTTPGAPVTPPGASSTPPGSTGYRDDCPDCPWEKSFVASAERFIATMRPLAEEARRKVRALEDERTRFIDDNLGSGGEKTKEQALGALANSPGLKDIDKRLRDAEGAMFANSSSISFMSTELSGARRRLEACLRACSEPSEQLRVVVAGAGNNPFNPIDPIGGGGAVIRPPDPGQPGTLQFSNASFSGSEGGAVLIVVVRSGGNKGAVSVQYATAAQTASAGGDFTVATGTLTWLDGEVTPKSFSIALPDDTQVESTETFAVSLTAPTGGAALGSPATATVSIADNDSAAPPQPAGNLQFSAATYSATEGPGASVTITVTRTGGSTGVVGVTYLTGPSSAVAGSDYTATSGNLTWANGDTAPKSFSVPILDDAAVEGPETFFVTLNSPSGGATLGAPATATVTIADNDVATGPCGATGSAWTPNAGSHVCSGSCSPTPSPQQLSVSGDIVTINPFHAGGPATFQGCGASLTSQSNTLTYFGQSNHTATITRSGDIGFSANIVSSGGGSCSFSCSRTGP